MYITRRLERAVQEAGGIFARIHAGFATVLPGFIFNTLLLLWTISLVLFWLLVGGPHCGYRYRRMTVGIINPVKRFCEEVALGAIYDESRS